MRKCIEFNTYEFELTPLLIVMHVPDDYMNVHIKKKRIDFENSKHSHLQYGKPYHVQVFSGIDDIRRQEQGVHENVQSTEETEC